MMSKTKVGTYAHMSPEVFMGLPYNYKSDIWAVGTTLFHMMAKEQLFKSKGNTEGEQYVSMFTAVTEHAMSSLPQGYSQELTEILTLCLKRNPNERPSVNEILDKPMFELLKREHLTEEIYDREFPSEPLFSEELLRLAGPLSDILRQ